MRSNKAKFKDHKKKLGWGLGFALKSKRSASIYKHRNGRPKPEGAIGVLQVVTFGVQLGSVFGEALEANFLSKQVQELFEGGTGCLVVVHLLLGALARPAIHHSDLHLETQLGNAEGGERKSPKDFT